MRIGIVGLGIGGATAGAAMSMRGMDVTIFEQSSEMREVGAGVATWPNTIRLLNRMGIGERLAEIGTSNRENAIRNARGDILHHVSSKTYDDTESYYLHRADLLQAIASRVPKDRVRLNARCIAVREESDEAIIDFADGSSESFDVVIGADGIRSVVIDAVTDGSVPIYSNLAAYRGLVPNEGAARLDDGTLWTDRKKYFVAFPVSGGAVVNFVGVVPTPGKPEESWLMPGSKTELAREYADWDPVVRAIIDKVEETFRWGLYFREPLKRITRGRIALMGDAAHPMLIQAGQGVGQAMEDGVALAVLLNKATPREVKQRLKLYEQLRLPRATAVQTLSRGNAQFMHADFPLQPGERRPERAGIVDWIVDYDVEREAKAVLAS